MMMADIPPAARRPRAPGVRPRCRRGPGRRGGAGGGGGSAAGGLLPAPPRCAVLPGQCPGSSETGWPTHSCAAAQPRRLCPSGGAGAQHPRREETISFAPQQRLVQPYPPALSLTHSTINAGRAPPGRVRRQSSAALTRSLCRSVSAPAPAGGRTLRAAREQGRTGAAPASAAAAVGRTGPHVACTARQIPCQIANKIYRRLSCFYRDFPSIFDLLPPFLKNLGKAWTEELPRCHVFQTSSSSFNIAICGVLVGLRLASTSITNFLQVP